MDTELHTYILEQVRVHIISLLNKKYNERQYSDEDLFRLLFKNYRNKNKLRTGLSLTYFGQRALSKEFKGYTDQINFESKNMNKTRHSTVVALDKNMKWPYYIGKKHVMFFSEDDASWFRLSGSNLNDFSGYV